MNFPRQTMVAIAVVATDLGFCVLALFTSVITAAHPTKSTCILPIITQVSIVVSPMLQKKSGKGAILGAINTERML